jgi:hypothetical protein
MTAAAPAVYAKERPDGRLSKALALLAVVPTTWRSARLTSARGGLIGDRNGVFLKKGDGDGFSLIPGPRVGLIILELFGVSDIASSKIIVEVDRDSKQTSQDVMARACRKVRNVVGVGIRHAAAAREAQPSGEASI